MKDKEMVYEPSALAGVGDFAELTQISGPGPAEDNPWFDVRSHDSGAGGEDSERGASGEIRSSA